jgi:hypothetical protein
MVFHAVVKTRRMRRKAVQAMKLAYCGRTVLR